MGSVVFVVKLDPSIRTGVIRNEVTIRELEGQSAGDFANTPIGNGAPVLGLYGILAALALMTTIAFRGFRD
jgi:hypothetical protein